MKDYYSLDCKTIREIHGISQSQLSSATGISRVTIARLEAEMFPPSLPSLELLYGYSYRSGLQLNENHADIMEDDSHGDILLFHGSKNQINGPVSLEYSKSSNDFGKGFYAGETYEQAACYISSSRSRYVYAFYLKLDGLKVYEMSADLEWVIAVSYFRGRIDEYSEHPKVQEIVSKIKESDLVIAPIADNSMYETLNEFASGAITDEQCRHSIRANYLGKQYVFLTKKALDNIRDMTSLYLCNEEKSHFKDIKIALSTNAMIKVELAKISFRRKGRYIDEIFN